MPQRQNTSDKTHTWKNHFNESEIIIIITTTLMLTRKSSVKSYLLKGYCCKHATDAFSSDKKFLENSYLLEH